MATGSKAGLYQNAQSASYLPLTLNVFTFPKQTWDLRTPSTLIFKKIYTKTSCGNFQTFGEQKHILMAEYFKKWGFLHLCIFSRFKLLFLRDHLRDNLSEMCTGFIGFIHSLTLYEINQEFQYCFKNWAFTQ